MPNVGDTVTCAETGKSFVAAQVGCTFNYATNDAGEIISDEGVDVREKRELLDRSKPFTCYLSSDMKHATGWKGNRLGNVIWANKVTLTRWSAFHGKFMWAVRVRDIHGGLWYGRGSGGICINLRPMKG